MMFGLTFPIKRVEPPPPPLPKPLLSEDFADQNFDDRGWKHGYHPVITDEQLRRGVYQMRWTGSGNLPVRVSGTTSYALHKLLPVKVKEMTVAFKVLYVRWAAADGSHFVGSVPAQDLTDDMKAVHGPYLADSMGRWYFETTKGNFRWGGIMQADYSNNTGYKYFNSRDNVMTLGHWHEIVSHARQNSVGNADGIFRVSMRRRGKGTAGTWGPWGQIVDATFGNMVSAKNPDLIQSWITVEPWSSVMTPKELRLCDLRVYAGDQYAAYQNS